MSITIQKTVTFIAAFAITASLFSISAADQHTVNAETNASAIATQRVLVVAKHLNKTQKLAFDAEQVKKKMTQVNS